MVTSTFLSTSKSCMLEIMNQLEGIKNWFVSDWSYSIDQSELFKQIEGELSNDVILKPGFDSQLGIIGEDEEIIEDIEVRCLTFKQLTEIKANINLSESSFLHKKLSKNRQFSMPVNHLQEDALLSLKEVKHAIILKENAINIKLLNWFSLADHFLWMLPNNEKYFYCVRYK